MFKHILNMVGDRGRFLVYFFVQVKFLWVLKTLFLYNNNKSGYLINNVKMSKTK